MRRIEAGFRWLANEFGSGLLEGAAPGKTGIRRAARRHASNRGRAKRRPGHNLLIRLHRFKDDVLRFLADFAVPFTNNLGPNRRCA